MLNAVIFDFRRTLYDPDTNSLMPNANDLLYELVERGYSMALVAKGDPDATGALLESLDIRGFFRRVRCLEGEKTEYVFDQCAKEMRYQNYEIAVVGNSIRQEIRLANRLGMYTILFRNGFHTGHAPENEAEKPRVTIASLDEVLNYLPPIEFTD